MPGALEMSSNVLKEQDILVTFYNFINLFFSYLKKTAHENSILSQSFNSKASGRP